MTSVARTPRLLLAAALATVCCWLACSVASADAPPAEILFASAGRVASIDASGDGRRVLPPFSAPIDSPSEVDSAPAISGDGLTIAYVEEIDPDPGSAYEQLVLAKRDGTDPVVVRDGSEQGDATFASPSFSPDGRLHFVEQVEPSPSRLLSRVVSVGADGSAARVEAQRTLRISRKYSGAYIWEAEVAPDGRSVLATLLRGPRARPDLVILDGGGKTDRTVRRYATGGSWSPDGRRILFELGSKLFTTPVEGGRPKRLTSGSGSEWDGAWSPTGERIAFVSDRNEPGGGEDGGEIYTVATSGSRCLTWLTNGAPASSSPVWGPELDRESAPRECGSRGRPPLVELVPEPDPLVNGEPIDWPRLWLGPVYGGMAQSYFPDDGRELSYSDCVFFERRRCGRLRELMVGSEDSCYAWVQQTAHYGEVRRGVMRRGALVFLPRGKSSEAVVLTGGQDVTILAVPRRRGERPAGAAELLRAVESLRPVGSEDATAPLEAPVVDREMVALGKRVAAAVRRTGSLDAAARRLSRREREVRLWNAPKVRSWLAIHRALERFGPFRTKDCGWAFAAPY